MALQKIYSDLDFSFTRVPGRNDIGLSYDEMAVIRAVRYLLLTKPYERPFQPGLGSRIEKLLFEPISSSIASVLEAEIRNTIENYEPRAIVSQITIYEKPDNNAYSVQLEFYIGNNATPTAINLVLERSR